MLQQTQVKTVLPYFERWIKTLPDVSSVANAKEEMILKLWEGLGYYTRARNLQKAAKMIVEKWDGVFPSTYSDILSLPGVGEYTAGAIASIAFNLDTPVVDGNVIRVLSRLKNFKDNTRLPENVKKMWSWAEELLPHGHARDFNQAMMELGALICLPKNPKCSECPLCDSCIAFSKGDPQNLPNRGASQKTESIRVAIAVIRDADKVFIQKRPSSGLMGGLWEFPGGKIEKGETPRRALIREINEELGIVLKDIHLITIINHAYTRFKVELHCFSSVIKTGTPLLKQAEKGQWVSVSKLNEYPFPAANAKLIRDFLI